MSHQWLLASPAPRRLSLFCLGGAKRLELRRSSSVSKQKKQQTAAAQTYLPPHKAKTLPKISKTINYTTHDPKVFYHVYEKVCGSVFVNQKRVGKARNRRPSISAAIISKRFTKKDRNQIPSSYKTKHQSYRYCKCPDAEA